MKINCESQSGTFKNFPKFNVVQIIYEFNSNKYNKKFNNCIQRVRSKRFLSPIPKKNDLMAVKHTNGFNDYISKACDPQGMLMLNKKNKGPKFGLSGSCNISMENLFEPSSMKFHRVFSNNFGKSRGCLPIIKKKTKDKNPKFNILKKSIKIIPQTNDKIDLSKKLDKKTLNSHSMKLFEFDKVPTSDTMPYLIKPKEYIKMLNFPEKKRRLIFHS